MSRATEIPYQLRLNKCIDRQVFLELLTRVLPQKKVGHYVYISMGGKHLADHEAMYRRLGLKNLFSFDGSEEVVKRQLCNKPIRQARCVEMMSGELPDRIENIIGEFYPASNVIAWLDYTSAHDRLSQIEEFVGCLQKAQAGDVFRITMNAFSVRMKGNFKKEGYSSPAEYRAAVLKQQMDDYFPSDITEVSEDEIPRALAQTIKLACSEAEKLARITFEPLLLTEYADGQRMFTATVLARANSDQLPTGVLDWEFRSKNWSEILKIEVPDLSLKEKAIIDRQLHRSPDQIIKAVKFVPGDELATAKTALLSYKQLHRFYPAFSPMSV